MVFLSACGGGGNNPSAPTVTSVTPLVSAVNVPTTFAVVGTNLPTTAVLIPQDGTCAAATGNTATGFSQQCTFTSAGQKSLVIAVGSGYSFSVSVAASQYVKICNDGAREGTFACPANPVQGAAANEWACTLDTLTNQMWEVKASSVGLRNVNNQYTSFDDITKPQKFVAGAVVPPTQAQIDASTNVVGYASALNDLTGSNPLCGSTKWRVPTLPELTTLVKGSTAPKIDAVYFPNTSAQTYITATPQIFPSSVLTAGPVTSTNSISVVDFNSGAINTFIFRESPRPLRLISAPSPLADSSKRLAVGAHHNCAIKGSGDVFCWGSGGSGELGNGGVVQSSTPVKVSMTGAATAVAAGDYHTCAIKAGGQVVCWGNNSEGQLGNGANVNSAVPVAVNLAGGAKMISARGDNTCAIQANGQAVCWGRGGVGGLGNGSNVSSNVPVAVSIAGSVTDISVGSGHACAVKANADLVCWGYGIYGQLGNGAAVTSNLPVTVTLPGGAASVSAGGLFTCAITVAGQSLCWGENSYGQIGNGSTSPGVSSPTAVSLPPGVSKLAAGYFHSCALNANGATLCWGYGVYGALGRGSTASSSVPVVASLPNGAVSAIGAGGYHTCALKNDSSIDCWGYGIYGQLGNASTANASLPVAVSGF